MKSFVCILSVPLNVKRKYRTKMQTLIAEVKKEEKNLKNQKTITKQTLRRFHDAPKSVAY